ncbi:MAG: hypothetical protein MZV63_31340 [Marinilabiliales bacterium]|nr:hypothetical protein [Marinilabiliales bacterium]
MTKANSNRAAREATTREMVVELHDQPTDQNSCWILQVADSNPGNKEGIQNTTGNRVINRLTLILLLFMYFKNMVQVAGSPGYNSASTLFTRATLGNSTYLFVCNRAIFKE